METYYTKKEYNQMKSALTKEIRSLKAKVAKLTAKLAESRN